MIHPEEQVEPEGLDPNEPTSDPTPEPERVGASTSHRQRIPDSDPKAHEPDKSFMVVDEEPPLAVTLAEGAVTETSAPPRLTFDIGACVADLIEALRNGITPPFYGAVAKASMTLMFGDPPPHGEQQTIPESGTEAQAGVVAGLIDLEGDALFDQALQLGNPIKHYIKLLELVENAGVRLTWEARNYAPRVLSPTKAQRQHERLTEPPEMRESTMQIRGLLYRVHTETTHEDFKGTVGVDLHKDSPVPSGTKSRKCYPILYADLDLEGKIKNGLVGEYVKADIQIREPVFGTTVTREPIHPVLLDIRKWDVPSPPPLPFEGEPSPESERGDEPLGS